MHLEAVIPARLKMHCEAVNERVQRWNWKAVIELVWRLTWRVRPSEFGDILEGHDRVNLELHSEIMTEQFWRCTWRP